MTRIRFQQGLDDLKHKLLVMGGMAEQALDQAVRAYRDHNPDLCRQVFSREAEINQLERDIDELALDLLAMQQPMAVDLRFIVAVIKINSDLERLGDQAVNIAERFLEMSELPTVALPVDLPRMAGLASAMVRQALESFIHADPELARKVCAMDDDVDRMNRDAQRDLQDVITKAPFVAAQCIDALIIARNLERIADHATNIAEDVIFWTSGADVRHNYGSAG
jgi:phosphate transport system protein